MKVICESNYDSYYIDIDMMNELNTDKNENFTKSVKKILLEMGYNNPYFKYVYTLYFGRFSPIYTSNGEIIDSIDLSKNKSDKERWCLRINGRTKIKFDKQQSDIIYKSIIKFLNSNNIKIDKRKRRNHSKDQEERILKNLSGI